MNPACGVLVLAAAEVHAAKRSPYCGIPAAEDFLAGEEAGGDEGIGADPGEHVATSHCCSTVLPEAALTGPSLHCHA